MISEKFCEKCGTKISNEANFCSACGQRTTQMTETDNRSLTMAQDLKKAVSISAESRPFRYASTARRTIGGLIDMAIVFILSVIPTFFLLMASVPPEGLTREQYAKYLGFSFGLIVSVAYEALLQSSHYQATFGQRLMKAKVTDLNGNRVSLSKALGRTLMSCISSVIFKLGYVIQPFTSRKQTLHDMVAGTIVLDADKTTVENVKKPADDAESKIQESGHDDRISGFRQVETEAVRKASIWKQKHVRLYAIGIFCLAVVVGLLVFGYGSNIGIFGPIRYDVYSCKGDSPPGVVDSWSEVMGRCEGDPQYKAEFRVDKTSSSVYVIFDPYETVPADNRSAPKKKLRLGKLPDCNILDEQNWTCGGKTEVILDDILRKDDKWQMVKGDLTTEPGYMQNVKGGYKGYGSYNVFKKK